MRHPSACPPVWLLILMLLLPLCSTAAGTGGSQESRPAAAALVNLNTATAQQLDRLPGVGPKTAALILEYRQKTGGFKRVEDLMNVRGIGEKTFLKLRPLITVTPMRAGGDK